MPHNFPHDELEPGLDETAFYDPKNFTFPSGAHIAEIEIDPDTGHLTIVNFTAADDFGRIINPMIVAGQVHGGLAQGIGQALLEGCVYDKETGQLLTGSYNDYAMPRAADLPNFELSTHVTLCTHNPLGVKGCGEAGAIGAPAAIANAIVDALKPLGRQARRDAGDPGAAVAHDPAAPDPGGGGIDTVYVMSRLDPAHLPSPPRKSGALVSQQPRSRVRACPRQAGMTDIGERPDVRIRIQPRDEPRRRREQARRR